MDFNLVFFIAAIIVIGIFKKWSSIESFSLFLQSCISSEFILNVVESFFSYINEGRSQDFEAFPHFV